MKGNFETCFADMENWEGWHQFSNDPHDPGGATYCGVTQRAYDGWRRKNGKLPQGVANARDDEVKAIYLDQYWTPIRGDELYAGLDLVVFDCAVNEGVVQASKDLQRVLGLNPDGQIGLETIGAVQRVIHQEEIIRQVCERRFNFWRGLTNARYFLTGWMARGEDIERRALSMNAASWRKAA